MQENKLTLTQGILTAAIGASLWLNPNAIVRILGSLGMIGGSSAIVRTIREKKERQAVLGYFDAVGNEFEDLVFRFADSAHSVAGVAVTEGRTMVKNPEKFVTAIQQYADSSAKDSSWVKASLRRSVVLCAPSKSGKTFLMNLILFLALTEIHPGCDLKIVDIDYLRTHEGEEPNDWLGYPESGVIQSREEACEYLISLGREVDDTKNKKFDTWRVIVIDEYKGLLKGIKDEKLKKEVMWAVSTIIDRGLKAKVKLVVTSQSPLAADLGISSTDRSGQVDFIILGDSIAKEDFIKFIVGEDHAKQYAANAKAFRSLPGCKRAAMITSGDEFALKVVPSIDRQALKDRLAFGS
jgi:hypothetical protein